MRFFLRSILLCHLLFATSLFAQNNDTTIELNDSSRQAVRQSVKNEFERWQDSVQAARIKREVEKNGKPLDVFLQEMKEQENSRKRQLYYRIGLGVLFLIVLVIGLARRRKR
jgi:hypothetical protein